jgi:UDPglucose 6-dehydrogenase
MLRAVMEINYDQRKRFVTKLRHLLGGLRGKTVGVLGLSFKPNTDDMRDAPSVEIINLLLYEGARVQAYDPVAMENARRVLGNAITYCKDPYQVAEQADALLLVSEWNEFKQLNMERVKALMRQPMLLDGRNISARSRYVTSMSITTSSPGVGELISKLHQVKPAASAG